MEGAECHPILLELHKINCLELGNKAKVDIQSSFIRSSNYLLLKEKEHIRITEKDITTNLLDMNLPKETDPDAEVGGTELAPTEQTHARKQGRGNSI